MDIEKKVKDDITIFYLEGSIDFMKAPKVKTYLLDQIEKENLIKIVINLKDVSYIDSSGIGALLGIVTKIRSEGKIKMRLCHIKASVFSVLKLTGLIGLFQIDNTEEESIESISK